MEHLEVHIIKSSHDMELATIAGLFDEFEDLSQMSCDLCEEVISFTSRGSLGLIVLSDSKMKKSCETCLTVAIQTVTVSDT